MTIPAWAAMWGLAVAVFAACKVWTWSRHRKTGPVGRQLAYLFLWPGMDAAAFLDPAIRPTPPRGAEWLFGIAKTAMGAALVWIFAPRIEQTMLRGWVGLMGMVFILHFGTFHLASLAWRSVGIQAVPLMKAPILSATLGELWGRRWNLGFHDVARDMVFEPLAPKVGSKVAALAVFLASGLVHDLVISVPAGGGWGLPTAYFLLQGAGVLLERKLRLTNRVFAIVVAVAPMYALFHPPFVRNVFLPFMKAVGA